MAGFSVIDVDIGKAAPFLGVAAVALAVWYIWSKSKAQADASTQAANSSPLAIYQQAQDLALLKSFTGGSSVTTQATTSIGTTTPVQDPLLPSYSAPGNPAQNFTAPALATASLGPASTTSNGI